MQALRDYQKMIVDVDRLSRRIVSRHRDHIACTRRCAGNCCRIHVSVYPVEAISMARALHKLAPDLRRRIQHKARHTNSFGPCPLLEDRTCLMYDARALICRTHGLPMLTEYKDHRAIGFCQKNFRNGAPISEDDIFNLSSMNKSLAAINRKFVNEFAPWLPAGEHMTISEALLIDISSFCCASFSGT